MHRIVLRSMFIIRNIVEVCDLVLRVLTRLQLLWSFPPSLCATVPRRDVCYEDVSLVEELAQLMNK